MRPCCSFHRSARLTLLWLSALGAGLPGPAATALAQTARDESVQLRPRPDFDAEGIYFDDLVDGVGRAMGLVKRDQPRAQSTSSVIIFPRLILNNYWDNNVLRLPTGKRSDFGHSARASLDINTDRDTHGFEFGGYGEIGWFDRLVSENYHQFGGYGGAFLVPTDETRLSTRLSAERLRQPREEIGAGTSQLRPTVYHLLTASVKGEYQDADWLLTPSGTFKSYTYQSNPPVVLGSEFDRDEFIGSLRIGHSVTTGSAVFIEPQLNRRSYHQAVSSDDGLHHDSSGWQIIAGARFDFSSVTYAELGGGWLRQSYVDPALKTLSGPALLAAATWNPRDWITFTLDGNRQIVESILPGVSGIEATAVQGTLNYEIDYDWLANANLGYTVADYRGAATGTNSARTDNILRYGLGTRYLLNRRMALGFNWSAFDRSSNTPGAQLTFNQYIVSVQLQW